MSEHEILVVLVHGRLVMTIELAGYRSVSGTVQVVRLLFGDP